MDEVDIEDLTIEQYLRLTQENQTPKKIEDMTIAEYVEYEKKMNENHISNTKSYLPTYFSKSAPTHDPIREFAHYFGPNQPGAEFDCDLEDMEEEVEYMTDDEVVMSEHKESNHGYTQNIQHFEEKDDVDKWLYAEITKHMSNETSFITSSEVDTDDDNTSTTASCLLPKELSPGSFLLPFNIDNHSLYAITTLDAKDNIIPLNVYEYLGLDEFRGRPFLESTHAQIDVFNEEILFEIGREKFKFNINSHQCVEKIYMVDTGQEEETFDPLEIGMDLFSYESPACLEFEQRTRSYGTPNLQDEIAEPISFLPDRRGLVKRWHVCKPIHVTYDDGNGEDCGMWPTCDPDLKFCFGYNEVFGVNEQGALRMWICFRDHERRTVKGSYMGFADFLQEWLKIRIEHNNLHESDREFIFNEWILDSYDVEEEYAREIGDPYSRRFDEYNRKTNEAWHDEAYEEDEMWRIGDEKTDYDPPYVNIETFEVKKYSFKGGRSFICITDHEDKAVPLGRVNGARFKAMIKKELEGHKIKKLRGNSRDRLDSYSFGNLAEFAAVTP
ncbi:hypothetical protein Tco_1403708 [Tanacetum coccineum]